MAIKTLPLSRIIDVTIERATIFPTRRGFGTLLLLTNDATGVVDATDRTKLYSTPEEVAEDYASTSEPYKAALAAFSVQPKPLFIKIGYYNDANPIQDELDAIEAYDSDWYGLVFTKEMRDSTDVDSVAEWVEARVKLYMTCSNDALTEDANDQTHVAARLHLAGYDRTGVCYHTNDSEYMDVAFMARGLRVNFQGQNSTITMKFKKLHGIEPLQKSSAVITAITGFVPGQGLVDSAGHYANAYVNIAGNNMLVEGNMASGEWFDTMHGADWLQFAISYRIYTLLVKEKKVPYTNVGTQMIVDEVKYALEEGVNNGFLASDFDEDGNFIPPYTIDVNRVSTVPPSQRGQRIAPPISFVATIAGAIHYATVNGTLTV